MGVGIAVQGQNDARGGVIAFVCRGEGNVGDEPEGGVVVFGRKRDRSVVATWPELCGERAIAEDFDDRVDVVVAIGVVIMNADAGPIRRREVDVAVLRIAEPIVLRIGDGGIAGDVVTVEPRIAAALAVGEPVGAGTLGTEVTGVLLQYGIEVPVDRIGHHVARGEPLRQAGVVGGGTVVVRAVVRVAAGTTPRGVDAGAMDVEIDVGGRTLGFLPLPGELDAQPGCADQQGEGAGVGGVVGQRLGVGDAVLTGLQRRVQVHGGGGARADAGRTCHVVGGAHRIHSEVTQAIGKIGGDEWWRLNGAATGVALKAEVGRVHAADAVAPAAELAALLGAVEAPFDAPVGGVALETCLRGASIACAAFIHDAVTVVVDACVNAVAELIRPTLASAGVFDGTAVASADPAHAAGEERIAAHSTLAPLVHLSAGIVVVRTDDGRLTVRRTAVECPNAKPQQRNAE